MLRSILTKQNTSIGAKAFATVTAIVMAVALPQVFHLLGAFCGLGTALGETFLPMHLPILLVGLLAGPYVGGIAGAVSPLLSFALTGMPGKAMLPFIVIELCVYGVASGLMRDCKLPTIGKVLGAQIAGRAVRAIAIVLAVYVIKNSALSVDVIWNSIKIGLFGLILQWVFLPLVIYRIEHSAHDEQ